MTIKIIITLLNHFQDKYIHMYMCFVCACYMCKEVILTP